MNKEEVKTLLNRSEGWGTPERRISSWARWEKGLQQFFASVPTRPGPARPGPTGDFVPRLPRSLLLPLANGAENSIDDR